MSSTSSIGGVSPQGTHSRNTRSSLTSSSSDNNSTTELLFDALLQWTPADAPAGDSILTQDDSGPKLEEPQTESNTEPQEEELASDKDESDTIVAAIVAPIPLACVPICEGEQTSLTGDSPLVAVDSGTEVVSELPATEVSAVAPNQSTDRSHKSEEPRPISKSLGGQTKEIAPAVPVEASSTAAVKQKGQSQLSIDRGHGKKIESKITEAQKSSPTEVATPTKVSPLDKKSTNATTHVAQEPVAIKRSQSDTKEDSPTRNRRELQLEKNRHGDRPESHGMSLVESSDKVNTPDKEANRESESVKSSAAEVKIDVQNAALNSGPTPITAVQPSAPLAAAMGAMGANLGNEPAARIANSNSSAIAGNSSSTTTGSGSSSASASSGSRSSGTLSTRQEVRLVQRVMRGFEQLSNGDGQVKLRLHPPQLGSLQMTLKMEGTQMSAKLEVENTLARDALIENLPKLREKLAEQGIQIDQFDVQLAPSESNSGTSANGDQRGNLLGQPDSRQGSSSDRRSPGNWRSQIDRLSSAGLSSEPTTPAVPSRRFESRGLDLTA